MPVPVGWELAPNDDTSRSVITANGWSTVCVVLADGTAWGSANIAEEYHNTSTLREWPWPKPLS